MFSSRAPQPLSMSQLHPEQAGSEQESPCNSLVRDYSEGRELGDRSQQYETHVMDKSSHLPFRNHQQYLSRCPNLFYYFFTQANREIPLFVQGYLMYEVMFSVHLSGVNKTARHTQCSELRHT